MQKSVQWLGMALLVPFVLGCGGSKPYSIVPVEGTLMMDGKPIDKIAVRFVPIEQGPESTGISDAQGHFVLHTTETKPEDGAVIGQHKVLLTDTSIYTKPFEGRASEGVDLTEGKSPRISIRYRVLHGTPLEVSVRRRCLRRHGRAPRCGGGKGCRRCSGCRAGRAPQRRFRSKEPVKAESVITGPVGQAVPDMIRNPCRSSCDGPSAYDAGCVRHSLTDADYRYLSATPTSPKRQRGRHRLRRMVNKWTWMDRKPRALDGQSPVHWMVNRAHRTLPRWRFGLVSLTDTHR